MQPADRHGPGPMIRGSISVGSGNGNGIVKMATSVVARHSKLQRDILRVYRQLLRAADGREGMKEYIRNEFHKNSRVIDRKNVLQIEYLLRRAHKQLKSMASIDGVTRIGTSTP